jgi:hypothetical protein
VTFFQGKTPLLPYLHKNFEKVHQRLQQSVQNLERKFDNMSWFTAIVFGNIASVSEVERVYYGLRGSIFEIFVEHEVAGAEPSFLQNKKKEERSKQPLENLSKVSSQKSEKSCSG